MKKLALLFILFSTLGLVAQNFQGYVTYKTTYSSKGDEKAAKDTTKTLLQRQQIKGKLRYLKAMEKEYSLSFNATNSIYKENKKLRLDNRGFPLIPDDPNKIYKNLKENYYQKKSDLMGSRYIIKDSLKTYEWKLIPGQKTIKGFTCYKAIFTNEVIVAHRGQENEDGSFSNVPVKRDIRTTAWYTPQIPLSNGPDMLGGLPGLILEINTAGGLFENTCVATNIVLNPNKKQKISPLKGGKVLTEKEFKETIKLKTQLK